LAGAAGQGGVQAGVQGGAQGGGVHGQDGLGRLGQLPGAGAADKIAGERGRNCGGGAQLALQLGRLGLQRRDLRGEVRRFPGDHQNLVLGQKVGLPPLVHGGGGAPVGGVQQVIEGGGALLDHGVHLGGGDVLGPPEQLDLLVQAVKGGAQGALPAV